MTSAKKTYYGFASLIVAMGSLLMLAGANYITRIDISPEVFSNWNNIIYLSYCFSAPLALVLGIWSFTRRNDFTVPSVIGMGLVTVPFLILFWQFVNALILYN